MSDPCRKLRLIVVGTSAGGVAALGEILPTLPQDFPFPVVVVVHLPPARDSLMAALFDRKCALTVSEAIDKSALEPGHVYFSPPDYHLLIESDFSIALSIDEPVNFSRPSIDVLLETAAASVGSGVLAIILTGTGSDGARGMKAIRKAGGIGWVQQPDSAQSGLMPRTALEVGGADAVLTLPEIAGRLRELAART